MHEAKCKCCTRADRRNKPSQVGGCSVGVSALTRLPNPKFDQLQRKFRRAPHHRRDIADASPSAPTTNLYFMSYLHPIYLSAADQKQPRDCGCHLSSRVQRSQATEKDGKTLLFKITKDHEGDFFLTLGRPTQELEEGGRSSWRSRMRMRMRMRVRGGADGRADGGHGEGFQGGSADSAGGG